MSVFLGVIGVLFYLPQIFKTKDNNFKIQHMIALVKLILQVFVFLISILL